MNREKLHLELDEISKLEKDWDSYGADPIPSERISFMRNVVDILCQAGIPPHRVVPGCDGDLNVYYFNAEGYEFISIGFDSEANGDVMVVASSVMLAKRESDAVLQIDINDDDWADRMINAINTYRAE